MIKCVIDCIFSLFIYGRRPTTEWMKSLDFYIQMNVIESSRTKNEEYSIIQFDEQTFSMTKISNNLTFSIDWFLFFARLFSICINCAVKIVIWKQWDFESVWNDIDESKKKMFWIVHTHTQQTTIFQFK